MKFQSYSLLFIIINCLLSNLTCQAVPAYPKPIKICNSEGDSVIISLKGDESCKYALSEDSCILLPTKFGWRYAYLDSDGNLNPSNFEIVPINKQCNELKFQKVRIESIIDTNIKQYITHQAKIPERRVLRAPMTGERRTLVILMQYPNRKFSKNKEEFEKLFNEIDYSDENASGSVRDYFLYASYNQLDCVSDIYGPYTSKFKMDFYGGNDLSGSDSNPMKLAEEAISNLPEDIDLSLYDYDNDGFIENIHIIFAGYGEEAGGPSNAIWSHEYSHQLSTQIKGFRFSGYSCTPELRGSMGNGISRIGVICHEMSHAFGACDFYDVDYATGGEYDGTGVWDLMASGSWNDSGKNPANINPYVKAFNFGWIEPYTLEKEGEYSIAPYNNEPEVYLINTSDPNDFYLFEYRKRTAFDTYLPGDGLLIYHAGPSLKSVSTFNNINNKHPQMMYVVCSSSGTNPNINGFYGNINSEDCPFPGDGNVTSFTTATMPGIFSWNNKNLPYCGIKDITLKKSYATFNYTLTSNTTSDPATGSDPENGNYLTIEEGFENGLADYQIVSNTGESWRIYPTSNWIVDQNIPEVFDGKKMLMLYGGKKSSHISESSFIFPWIELESDSEINVSLYANMPDHNALNKSRLQLVVADDLNENPTELLTINDYVNEWEQFSTSFDCPKKRVRFILNGTTEAGIFIDQIKILIKGKDVGKKLVYEDSDRATIYYDMSGIEVKHPSKGFYIARKGNDVKKIFIK